jgi:hypothetical protein
MGCSSGYLRLNWLQDNATRSTQQAARTWGSWAVVMVGGEDARTQACQARQASESIWRGVTLLLLVTADRWQKMQEQRCVIS